MKYIKRPASNSNALFTDPCVTPIPDSVFFHQYSDKGAVTEADVPSPADFPIQQVIQKANPNIRLA